jgi:hypothetical protein
MTTSEDFRAEGRVHRNRSTPGLVADLFAQTTALFGKEVQLVRAELNEKVAQGVAGLGLIVAGAVFLIGATNVLLAAAVTALIEAGIAAPWSSVIVGAAVAVVGLLLVSTGLNNLKTSNLTPTRTTDQLKRDAAMVREQVQ